MAETEWSDLPTHLKEKTLACLPLESLCRFRSVCKEWNALFTSAKFITGLWKEEPRPNKIPRLIFYNYDSLMPFPAYCFSTQTWNSCPSLSLILDSETPENRCYSFYFYGSVLGLFLVAPAFHHRPPPLDSFVCNPLRRTSSRLPAMPSITKVLAKGIVQGGEAETYRVVVVGESSETGDGINGRRQIVEIYDSSQKSWRTAGHLQDNLVGNEYWVQDNLEGNESWEQNPMVFGSDCFFYCMTTRRRRGIVGFNMREGISIFAALPELHDGRIVTYSHLLTCGSRILIAGIAIFNRRIQNVMTLLQEVFLWEFQRVEDGNSSWTEIARMPPNILMDFQSLRRSLPRSHRRSLPRSLRRNSRTEQFECVGVGDFVCFRPYRSSREVIVYDISKNIWSWLPNYTSPALFFSSMGFEPRPDMTVT